MKVFTPALADGFFHWSVSDKKSPQVSRTLLSILSDLYNAVIWKVSPRPLISKSSSSCSNRLVTVPSAYYYYYYYYYYYLLFYSL